MKNPSMDTLITIIIVTVAVVWALRRFIGLLRGKPTQPCGCGCSGCHDPARLRGGPADSAVQIQSSVEQK